ncbi:MAG TPA: hypothetical protein VG206_21345 [Terriglobia bacterium]|nr:hypothetical protein [Terriglobia bacterium]
MVVEWRRLWQRVQRRAVRALDVLSILALDAILLVFSYLVVRIVEALAGSGSGFYDAARAVSGVVLLVLYLAWAGSDLWEFLRRR